MIYSDMPSTYFRCFFVVKTDTGKMKYRVDSIVNTEHPFQLKRRDTTGPQKWESLSVYVSIRDCVGALLNDLFSPELRDEINHGQATIDSGPVLSKIDLGERCIYIHQTSNSSGPALPTHDINFEDLVIRRAAAPAF